MRFAAVNAPDAPAPVGGYAQAMLVCEPSRWLHIGGQVPEASDGSLAHAFDDQCRQVWANVVAQLHAAGMEVENLVKVTTYLADRGFATRNTEIRNEVLGSHTPALTVIVATIFDAAWHLEIEAVAAA